MSDRPDVMQIGLEYWQQPEHAHALARLIIETLHEEIEGYEKGAPRAFRKRVEEVCAELYVAAYIRGMRARE